ncbi:DUF4232 domain-containing protein [Streptomyces sp. NPDC029526]|uniref:DUF4232 domain-containing protein n=1 Tax=Streptomyces sp. NPDC029526 TaxID=3155728 RepID=UPI0033CE5F23
MTATTVPTRRLLRLRGTYALGAAVLAALLTTTACGPDQGDGTDTSRPSERTGAKGPSAEASPGADKDDDRNGDGGDAPATDDGTVSLCTLGDLSISASHYGAHDEPVRHLLLVATNTGDTKCDVQNAPEVTLGDGQGPAPVLEGTANDEVITLAPGEKAYAGLRATGGQQDTYDVTSMKVTLGSPGGEAEAEEPVDLPMPVASFPADDGQRVTHWAGTEGLAMRPITHS